MPNASDMLFSAISSMTGGLINDITTLMVGMLGLGFIVFGFEHLKDVFEESMHKRQVNASLDRARSYKKLADDMDDQVSKDYLNAKYRSEIRRASR